MDLKFIDEQVFEKKDYTAQDLEKGIYELCTFKNCDFSNSDLSKIQFIECEFYDCNLSSTNLFETGFQNVLFHGCKLMGLHFEKCSEFAFSIKVRHSQLNHSSFYQLKLPNTVFNSSKLEAVDFTECDLSHSIFTNCDLLDAIFDHTILEKADFKDAYNFIIDPENNRMKGAKFSLKTVKGLLSKYNISID